jgi:peptidoglycan LD-endopeptidase CwlK
MSFVFSRRSKKNLETCEIPLQTLATKALATSPIDFTIICGYRDKKGQEEAFASGASKLKFPNSKHNKWPALAFDAVPYPLDWHDIKSFQELGDHIIETWGSMTDEEKMGFDLSWGGTWKSFKDYPHYELRKKSS